MRATISMVLEGVAAALPRGQCRVQARESGRDYIVSVRAATGVDLDFPVRRSELATEARAEWVALDIARAVLAENAKRVMAPQVPQREHG